MLPASGIVRILRARVKHGERTGSFLPDERPARMGVRGKELASPVCVQMRLSVGRPGPLGHGTR